MSNGRKRGALLEKLSEAKRISEGLISARVSTSPAPHIRSEPNSAKKANEMSKF